MSDFLNYLILGITRGSMYALIALGYTLVYGVLQLINFAHSEVFMFGAFGSFFVVHALVGDGKGVPGWAVPFVLIAAQKSCSSRESGSDGWIWGETMSPVRYVRLYSPNDSGSLSITPESKMRTGSLDVSS